MADNIFDFLFGVDGVRFIIYRQNSILSFGQESINFASIDFTIMNFKHRDTFQHFDGFSVFIK